MVCRGKRADPVGQTSPRGLCGAVSAVPRAAAGCRDPITGPGTHPPFTPRSQALPQGFPPEPADGGAPQYSPRPPPA